MQLTGVFAKKTTTKPADKAGEMGEIIKFSDKGGFDFSIIFVSLALVIAVGVTFMFWWANRNLTTVVADRMAEKDAIIQEITSPTYREVERRAADFSDAVNELRAAASSRYAVTKFMPELFKYINKDVQLSNLSLSADHVLTITGKTKSYRSIAELILALQSWSVLSGVKLQSFGFIEDEDGDPRASFVISSSVDTSKSLKNSTGTTAVEEDSNSSSEGVVATPSSSGGVDESNL